MLSLSDSRLLPCSENLVRESERDGTRDANGERAGAFIAEEVEPPRDAAVRCALVSVVDCREVGVMETMG